MPERRPIIYKYLERLKGDIIPLKPDLVVSYHGYNGQQFMDMDQVSSPTPPRKEEGPSALLDELRPPEPGKRHFRNGGESGTWREEFSDSDKKLANDLIGDRIERAFARGKGREHGLRPD
jgi:hypothetical protein